jgi:RNA polymerase-binding transcription factor DksA
MVQANRLTAKSRLERFKTALFRFSVNEYDCCVGCEMPFGYPQLKAQREAAFCLASQKRQGNEENVELNFLCIL